MPSKPIGIWNDVLIHAPEQFFDSINGVSNSMRKQIVKSENPIEVARPSCR